ncbi:hypothetical protein LINPERPRIM_LOCUS14773 [Linum perenne]
MCYLVGRDQLQTLMFYAISTILWMGGMPIVLDS